ncbi:MAG: hypothetical protein AAF771_12660 [Pseudomonadota bacterium]
MKIKRIALAALALTTPTALAVAALSFAPTPADAAGCNYTKSDLAMSCAVGFAWDESKQTCVPEATS